MENLVQFVSIISAAIGLLITTVTFLIKFLNAIKQRNVQEAAHLIREGAEQAVKFVETVKSNSSGALDGNAKKTMAMTKINQFCIDHKIDFNEAVASTLIEEIVTLTKTVNARVKDANLMKV